MLKRCLDIGLSTTGLLLLAPLYALIPLAVVVDSGLPVLFSQDRVGRDARLFRILKFRSIRNGPGAPITVRNDSRVTRVGAFLRRTKLDELPQLVNVLRGDMSLVGPRPEIPQYVEMYPDRFRRILSVRPGLTDLASVRFRHEEELLRRGADPMVEYRDHVLPAKLTLAEEYVRRQSFWLDLSIMLATAQSLFSRSED